MKLAKTAEGSARETAVPRKPLRAPPTTKKMVYSLTPIPAGRKGRYKVEKGGGENHEGRRAQQTTSGPRAQQPTSGPRKRSYNLRAALDGAADSPSEGKDTERGKSTNSVESPDVDDEPSAKKRRPSGPYKETLGKDEAKDHAGQARKSSLSLTSHTTTKGTAKDRSKTSRASKFLEGSMNDRASTMPPSSYLAVDNAMENLLNAQGESPMESLTAAPNSNTSSQPLDGAPNQRQSGIFRFGKTIASAFNPSNLWDGVSHIWRPSHGQRSSVQSESQLDRKAKAETLYAEMKKNGQFGAFATSGLARTSQETPSAGPESTVSSSAPSLHRDSGVEVDGYRSSGDSRRHGRYFGDVSLMPPPSTTSRSRSPSPAVAGRTMAALGFKGKTVSVVDVSTPSLTDLRSAPQSQSLFHLPQVMTMSEEVGTTRNVIRKQRSKKDLQKVHKLNKKVSDLEGKLEAARRELQQMHDMADAPPVPALPKEVSEGAVIPHVWAGGSVGRREPFRPGALPTLLSEGVLFPVPAETTQPDDDENVKTEESRAEPPVEMKSAGIQHLTVPTDAHATRRSPSVEFVAASPVSKPRATRTRGQLKVASASASASTAPPAPKRKAPPVPTEVEPASSKKVKPMTSATSATPGKQPVQGDGYFIDLSSEDENVISPPGQDDWGFVPGRTSRRIANSGIPASDAAPAAATAAAAPTASAQTLKVTRVPVLRRKESARTLVPGRSGSGVASGRVKSVSASNGSVRPGSRQRNLLGTALSPPPSSTSASTMATASASRNSSISTPSLTASASTLADTGAEEAGTDAVTVRPSREGSIPPVPKLPRGMEKIVRIAGGGEDGSGNGMGRVVGQGKGQVVGQGKGMGRGKGRESFEWPEDVF